VCIDDGSHHTISQITSFKQLFLHNLNPEGLYVIEDCHDYHEDSWKQGLVESEDDTLMGAMKNYLSGGDLISKLITPRESEQIMKRIESVDIYDDLIIFVKKKKFYT
jgi:hypothetical protein